MIYNTGTLSVSGNTATGAGTNFTAPASQIRVGQTLLVASNPVQLFQITAINSATSLTVTPAASPALSGQKYGILVTDSLSVDGLAQSISQLINEYDENIGAWEAFASTTANQNIAVTINGVGVTIPALGKLVQKGTNGAVPLAQGGTGATDAATARSNLGLGEWLPHKDPLITQYINFGGGSQASSELQARIVGNSIELRGIVRGSLSAGSSVLFSVIKTLPGTTTVYSPFAPAVLSNLAMSSYSQLVGGSVSVIGLGASWTATFAMINLVIIFS